MGVIDEAKQKLRQLESTSIREGLTPLQADLFSQPEPAKIKPKRPSKATPHPLETALQAIDPDSLTPRQALEQLYLLKQTL
jgi:DNA mismatch repair protein MutS